MKSLLTMFAALLCMMFCSSMTSMSFLEKTEFSKMQVIDQLGSQKKVTPYMAGEIRIPESRWKELFEQRDKEIKKREEKKKSQEAQKSKDIQDKKQKRKK